MAEFEHEGWRFAYEDRGDGPPVVVVHGVLTDRSMQKVWPA